MSAFCWKRIPIRGWATRIGLSPRAWEAAALEKAATAVASPDDPPEFARWLEALQRPELSVDEREEIFWAIHDYFADEETGQAR